MASSIDLEFNVLERAIRLAFPWISSVEMEGPRYLDGPDYICEETVTSYHFFRDAERIRRDREFFSPVVKVVFPGGKWVRFKPQLCLVARRSSGFMHEGLRYEIDVGLTVSGVIDLLRQHFAKNF